MRPAKPDLVGMTIVSFVIPSEAKPSQTWRSEIEGSLSPVYIFFLFLLMNQIISPTGTRITP